MANANVKLQLVFDFDLSVPGDRDPEALSKYLSDALGPMVLGGVPTISGKQLAKAGVTLVAHQCRVTASSTVVRIDHDDIKAAAPHLTDAELDQLAARVRGKIPAGRDERLSYLRRQALSMMNEFRMVPCVVSAPLTSGKEGRLAASLNITNGSVTVEAHDRQHRIQQGAQNVTVELAGSGATFEASYAGHTISGPVIAITIAELARHRDALIEVWQSNTPQ